MAKHFLTGEELTTAEQRRLLDRAIELKADRLSSRALEGKSVALVFDKPSTRTRVSFDTGVYELGDAIHGFAGDFVLLRATSPSGRGWRDELWSVSASGARAEVYAVPLGGAEDGDDRRAGDGDVDAAQDEGLAVAGPHIAQLEDG